MKAYKSDVCFQERSLDIKKPLTYLTEGPLKVKSGPTDLNEF